MTTTWNNWLVNINDESVTGFLRQHKARKVYACVFDEEAFRKWPTGDASYAEYLGRVKHFENVAAASMTTVVWVVFDEADYLRYLKREGLHPADDMEHSKARSQWALEVGLRLAL